MGAKNAAPKNLLMQAKGLTLKAHADNF